NRTRARQPARKRREVLLAGRSDRGRRAHPRRRGRRSRARSRARNSAGPRRAHLRPLRIVERLDRHGSRACDRNRFRTGQRRARVVRTGRRWRRRLRARASGRRRSRGNPGMNILVVDDEPQILRALRTTLRGAGYDVKTAATGEEALAAAAADPPEAVILDLVLPDLHGTEVCRELRVWSAAPILVLSAVGDEQEKVAALDAGADDYVTKPFGMDELLARLRA